MLILNELSKTLSSRIRSLPLLLLPCLLAALLSLSCSSAKLDQENFTLPAPAADTAPAARPELYLAAGDILSIEVWGQADLTKQVTIDATGAVYYPFIGKIQAAGQTVEQLQTTLTTRLSNFYVEPQLSIIPFKLTGRQYFVLGEVNQPGKFTLQAPMTVLEVLAAAGGPDQDAGKYVVLLRKKQDTLKLYSIPVKFEDLTDQHLYSMTMRVEANDVLYLPPSNFAATERFMKRLDSILNPILAIERGILYWPSLIDAIEGSSGDVLIPIQ